MKTGMAFATYILAAMAGFCLTCGIAVLKGGA